MDQARIAELLEPYVDGASDQRLTTNDLQHISTYIDLLQRWNARVNLTAIRNEEEIVIRHFGESLFAARHLFPDRSYVGTGAPACPAEQSSAAALPSGRDERSIPHIEEHRGRAALEGRVEGRKRFGALAPVVRLADVGSGAGFPGIPIKLWAPEILLTLIESNHKKATFLREVARTLTLTDINIQNTRAESLPSHIFDVVTLRAVERFETILPTAARLLAPSGRLVLLIGADQLPVARDVLQGLIWSDPLRIPLSRSRVLIAGRNQERYTGV